MHKQIILSALLCFSIAVFAQQDSLMALNFPPGWQEGEEKAYTLVTLEMVYADNALITESKSAVNFDLLVAEKAGDTLRVFLSQAKTNYTYQEAKDTAGLEALLYSMVQAVEESVISAPIYFEVDAKSGEIMQGPSAQVYLKEVRSAIDELFSYFENELKTYFEDPKELKSHLENYFIDQLPEKLLLYANWMELLVVPHQIAAIPDTAIQKNITVSPKFFGDQSVTLAVTQQIGALQNEGTTVLNLSNNYDMEVLVKKLKQTNASIFDWQPTDLVIIDRGEITINNGWCIKSLEEFIALMPGARIVRVTTLTMEE